MSSNRSSSPSSDNSTPPSKTSKSSLNGFKASLKKVAAATNSLARTFDRIVGLLTERDFIEGPTSDPHVTDDGRLLARIYSESDLLVAECLRSGAWAGLNWRIVELFSWMRLAKSHWNCSRSCYVFCRSGNSNVWAARAPFALTHD